MNAVVVLTKLSDRDHLVLSTILSQQFVENIFLKMDISYLYTKKFQGVV